MTFCINQRSTDVICVTPASQNLVGKHCTHPFCDRRLPIVADSFVDMSFGTGAVKITPAHDHNDYECGKRNDLPFVEMISDTGIVTDVCPRFKVGVVFFNHVFFHMTIKVCVYTYMYSMFDWQCTGYYAY